MTVILHSILLMLVLWLGSYAAYLLFNHGLAPNARLQQLLRYLVAVTQRGTTATSAATR